MQSFRTYVDDFFHDLIVAFTYAHHFDVIHRDVNTMVKCWVLEFASQVLENNQ